MRPSLKGPQDPHSRPGKLDWTPFKALPGEALIPVGRIPYVVRTARVAEENAPPEIPQEPLVPVAAPHQETSFLALPNTVLVFVFSLSSFLESPKQFLQLALVCKSLRRMVRESSTADLLVWKQFVFQRLPILRSLSFSPCSSWQSLLRTVVVAMAPPHLSPVLSFGCSDPLCARAPLGAPHHICQACTQVFDEAKEKEKQKEIPGKAAVASHGLMDEAEVHQHANGVFLVRISQSRAMSVAVWLYCKGYRGFEWTSKEVYDESGPMVFGRKCF